MEYRTIIFGERTKPIKPAERRPKDQEKKPRKKRCDALHDIKFRITAAEKKKLKTLAIEHNLSMTAFLSMIVKAELLKNHEQFNYDYDHNGIFVHVTLENDFFEMIKGLSIEWDQPFRKVAHALVMEYMFKKSGGIRVVHYQGGEYRGI